MTDTLSDIIKDLDINKEFIEIVTVVSCVGMFLPLIYFFNSWFKYWGGYVPC